LKEESNDDTIMKNGRAKGFSKLSRPCSEDTLLKRTHRKVFRMKNKRE
jgi:hypothetical protein